MEQWTHDQLMGALLARKTSELLHQIVAVEYHLVLDLLELLRIFWELEDHLLK